MAKKAEAKKVKKSKGVVKEQIVPVSLLEMAVQNLKDYGSYTIEQRALSDYRDGLKPVHRRLLWALNDLHLHHSGPVKKSARIVGDTIGKYHPHGDQGTYTGLVSMVNMTHPLAIGQGNWGNYEAEAAAYRYTECKLSKYANNYILDPDYLAVIDKVANFDGSELEPIILPAKLPNLLLNGSEGIAVGCSSLIPSFTLPSVVKIVRKALKSEITAKDCVKLLEFKFPWGGICTSSDSDLLSYFKTGSGSITFVPETTLVKNVIKVTSIAPRFNIKRLWDRVLEFKEVKDIEDRRSKKQILFNIILGKQYTDRELEKIYKSIQKELTSSLPCQTLVTIRQSDGETVKFKNTNIPTIINDWIKYRIDLETKVVKRLITLEEAKLQRQEWLLFAVLNRKVIIQSLENKDPKAFLMKKLKIKEDQANFILDLKVRNLAKLEVPKIKETILSIKKEIKFLKSELTNIKGRIDAQLSKIKE